MKYRIAIMAYHNDPLHPRDVEVRDSLEQLVTADPSVLIRVQTVSGDVQYHTAKRTLTMFNAALKGE